MNLLIIVFLIFVLIACIYIYLKYTKKNKHVSFNLPDISSNNIEEDNQEIEETIKIDNISSDLDLSGSVLDDINSL